MELKSWRFWLIAAIMLASTAATLFGANSFIACVRAGDAVSPSCGFWLVVVLLGVAGVIIALEKF